METEIDFRDLLRSLHNAILEAQIVLEQQHIRQLNRYFFEDGTPKVRRIKLPDVRPGATTKWRDVDVPLFALVPASGVELNHLLVEFQANVREVTDQDAGSLLLSFQEAPDPSKPTMKFRISFRSIPRDLGSLQLSDVSMMPVESEDDGQSDVMPIDTSKNNLDEQGASQDDFTKITGIDPEAARILYQVGILTYAQLATIPLEELEKILQGVGPEYLWTSDPRTWPLQAALAATGQWDKLDQMKKGLQELLSEDFTVIEGIGLKTKQLLHDAGIRTYYQLAKIPGERLQQILEEAGPAFRRMNPSPWSDQAAQAAIEQWDNWDLMKHELLSGLG